MFKKAFLSATLAVLGSTQANAQQTGNTSHPVVLELFTSQSCSSCPPADALLKQLAESDPSLLPLSFHVDYWDYLSWKDIHSSPDNTARQRGYSRAMRANNVFTPQLIAGGAFSAVGANSREVKRAIDSARSTPSPIAVTLTTGAGGQLTATLNATGGGLPPEAEIYEVQFDRYSKTQVAAGENGGRTLESINNVTRIRSLGRWKTAEGTKTFALDGISSEGVAILVQNPGLGAMLGAGAYVKAGRV